MPVEDFHPILATRTQEEVDLAPSAMTGKQLVVFGRANHYHHARSGHGLRRVLRGEFGQQPLHEVGGNDEVVDGGKVLGRLADRQGQ